MAVRKKKWWVYPPGGPVRLDMRLDAVSYMALAYLMTQDEDLLDLHEERKRPEGELEKSEVVRTALVRWCQELGFDPIQEVEKYRHTGNWPDDLELPFKKP